MQEVALDLPLELSAAVGMLSAVLYYFFFRNIFPPEEMHAPAAERPASQLRKTAG
jgi:hypothetical protein